MKHQAICKHKNLKENSFMSNKIYVCKGGIFSKLEDLVFVDE